MDNSPKCKFCNAKFTNQKNATKHERNYCHERRSRIKNAAVDKNSDYDFDNNDTIDNTKIKNNDFVPKTEHDRIVNDLRNQIQLQRVELEDIKRKYEDLEKQVAKHKVFSEIETNPIAIYLNTHNPSISDLCYLDDLSCITSQFANDKLTLATYIVSMNDYKKAVAWIANQLVIILRKEDTKIQQVWTSSKTFIFKSTINKISTWNADKKGILFSDLILTPVLQYVYDALVHTDLSTGLAEEITKRNNKIHTNTHILKHLEGLNENEFNVLLKCTNNESAIHLKNYNITAFEEFNKHVEFLKQRESAMFMQSLDDINADTKDLQKFYKQLCVSIETRQIYDDILKKIAPLLQFNHAVFESGKSLPFAIVNKPFTEVQRSQNHQRKIDSLKPFVAARSDLHNDAYQLIKYANKTLLSNKCFDESLMITDVDISCINNMDYNNFMKYVANKIFEPFKTANKNDQCIWNVNQFRPYFIYRQNVSNVSQWIEDKEWSFTKKHIFRPTIKMLKDECSKYKGENTIVSNILNDNNKTLINLLYCFGDLCRLII